MKEVKFSFEITVSLDRTDVHHLEEVILQKRQEVFEHVMEGVVRSVEQIAA